MLRFLRELSDKKEYYYYSFLIIVFPYMYTVVSIYIIGIKLIPTVTNGTIEKKK
jgi:hypothetical protein